MWSELYINDPDILSDVTEIAVKKLGYWIERRLREGRSSPAAAHFLSIQGVAKYVGHLSRVDVLRTGRGTVATTILLTNPRRRANLDPTDKK